MKISKRKKIKALELVKKMLDDDYQWVDYLLCGDKDTMRHAIDIVFSKHKLKDPDEYSFETRNELMREFDNEIDIEYKNAVKVGEEEKRFYNKLYEYLDVKIELFNRKDK